MKSSTTRREGGRGARQFGLGLITGVVTGLLVGRRLASRRRMPGLALVQKTLAKERGDVEAALLATRIQKEYDELVASRPRLSGRVLRLHLVYGILPGLALYRALGEDNPEQESVMADVERLLWVLHSQVMDLRGPLKPLSDPFGAFRQVVPWALKAAFPPEGWKIDWVEKSQDSIAFDIHDCFYRRVLEGYGAPELAVVFCNMDDLAFESLSPAISWERTTTLARGGDCCDFRWSRVSTGASTGKEAVENEG